MYADSLLTPTPIDGCGSTRSIVHLGMSTARRPLGIGILRLSDSNDDTYGSDAQGQQTTPTAREGHRGRTDDNRRAE